MSLDLPPPPPLMPSAEAGDADQLSLRVIHEPRNGSLHVDPRQRVGRLARSAATHSCHIRALGHIYQPP